MQAYCIWCRARLAAQEIALVLPAGTLYPWGACVCQRCATVPLVVLR